MAGDASWWPWVPAAIFSLWDHRPNRKVDRHGTTVWTEAARTIMAWEWIGLRQNRNWKPCVVPWDRCSGPLNVPVNQVWETRRGSRVVPVYLKVRCLYLKIQWLIGILGKFGVYTRETDPCMSSRLPVAWAKRHWWFGAPMRCQWRKHLGFPPALKGMRILSHVETWDRCKLMYKNYKWGGKQET